jgi:hypothetical protein
MLNIYPRGIYTVGSEGYKYFKKLSENSFYQCAEEYKNTHLEFAHSIQGLI